MSLRGPRRSEGSSLRPSGIQKLMPQGLLSALPMYSAIFRHWMPCFTQNARIFLSGLASVKPFLTFACEKNVGLKSSFTPVFFAHFTQGSNCSGPIWSRSTRPFLWTP